MGSRAHSAAMASTHSLHSPFQAPPLSLLAMEPVRALFDFAAAKFSARAEPGRRRASSRA